MQKQKTSACLVSAQNLLCCTDQSVCDDGNIAKINIEVFIVSVPVQNISMGLN